MESEYRHRLLVVDNDDSIKKAIDEIARTRPLEAVFADNGESALTRIKKAKTPFSLILSDLHIDGMQGDRFFEQVKRLSPDSIRFIVSTNNEIKTIIKAVNKASVQRYIVKPWPHDNLVNAILWGIGLYDDFLENERLWALAKKQNTTLYELNCKLMESTKSHNRVIHEMDSDIELTEQTIQSLSGQPPIHPPDLVDEIEIQVKTSTGIDVKKAETLFSEAILKLYDQFTEVAHRNGFDMPDIKGKLT